MIEPDLKTKLSLLRSLQDQLKSKVMEEFEGTPEQLVDVTVEFIDLGHETIIEEMPVVVLPLDCWTLARRLAIIAATQTFIDHYQGKIKEKP